MRATRGIDQAFGTAPGRRSPPLRRALLLCTAALAAAGPALAAAPPAEPAAASSGSAAQLAAFQKAFEDAFARRDWDAAADALQGSLTIQEATFGAESPIALSTLDTLALAKLLGQHGAEAEALFRRELEIRRRIEGEASPQLPRLLANIASSADLQGHFAEAEGFYRDALARQSALTGPASAETAAALSAHASALGRIGRSQEALAQAIRARDVLLGINGPDSLEAASGHDGVGRLLNSVGRYADGEAEHRKALAIRLKAAGETGEPTLASLNNLAISLTQQGKYAEAETLLRRALAARQAASGPRSIAAADVMTNLATTLQNGGNPAAAEPLLREALAIRSEASGPENPATLTITTNLSTCLNALGRFAEAERFARIAYTGRLKLHGENHPETAIAATNLAGQLSSLGRDVEAELLYRRALAGMQATNGEDHPDTASAYANLAYGLAQQGRFGDAADLHRKAIAIRRKVLGPDHPDTAENLGNLGYALAQQQDYEAADPLYREALALLRKHFGDDSLATARAYNNLAGNLDSLGKPKEAAPLYERALAIRRKRLGPDHPLTLISLNNVAYSRHNRADRKGALRLYREVVAAERRIYAASNPARTVPLNNLAMVLAERPGGDAEALQLAREATAIAGRRRAAILTGQAAGGNDAAQARIRARSGETLRNDPFVTSYIALMQVDWTAAGRDPGQLPRLRAEAFQAAQEIDVSSAALAMARTAARTAAGGGELGALVSRQQTLSEQLGGLEKSYATALAGQDRSGLPRLASEIDAASTQLAAADAEIARRFPDYHALIAPAALDVGEVQKRLRPGEGLLLVVPSNGDLFSFAVTADKVAWHRAPQRQIAMKREVATLVCQIDPQTCPAQAAAPPPSPFEQQGFAAFDRATAHGLYRDLVAPVEEALAGVTSLYVTTTGTLATLPLGLLVTAPPPPGDDADPALLGQTPWLANRYAITVLPAVSSLRTLDRARATTRSAFVGYGAPMLGEENAAAADRAGKTDAGPADANGALADQALLRSMSPLPGTLVELKAMASALGSPAKALRLGAGNTERAVKSDPELPKARVVAFATHGLLPRELGSYAEPGLVFTPPARPTALDDGVLAASEAAEFRLTADWVILSACNTAGAESGAESLSGLARSFLYAGAGSLLVSYWRVSDAATAVLTVETLKADQGLPRAQALQAGMQAVRSGRRGDGSAIAGWDPSWAHPAAWAPFSLIANRNE